MATTTELEKLLTSRLEDKVYKAFIATFPEQHRNDLQVQTAKKFAKDLSEYAKDEIALLQRVIIETIGIRFDLSTFQGENTYLGNEKARGYADSVLYKNTLSKSDNDENTSSRIVGKLDLVIVK